MSACPTCLPIDCDLTEDTALYSLEGTLYPFVLNCPPGFDCIANNFSMLCCGQLMSAQFPPNATANERITIIQGVVNECAVRQLYCGSPPVIPPPPTTPIQLYYNVPKQCALRCPDGTSYVYFVAAGVFLATSQLQADTDAQDYACVQAKLRQICLGSVPTCFCKGQVVSIAVKETGGIGPFTWSLQTGSLPNGLNLNGTTGFITGTTTQEGQFSFTIRVTSNTDGSYNQKPYNMTVITVNTTSLDPFTVGTPYSFQLVALGGSGNYQWVLKTGTLPDGLTMSQSGLITGTPTTASTSSFDVTVLDTSCEAPMRVKLPPVIALKTVSTTNIATVLGFPEYAGFASSPPKKYHTLTWTGTSEQQLWYLGTQIAGALFTYGGASNINGAGAYTSLYTKQLSRMCGATGSLATNFLFAVFGGLQDYVFTGWLGPAGNQKCAPPGIPYTDVGNQAIGKGASALHDSSAFWGSKKPQPTLSNVQVSNFNPISATQGVCVDVGGSPTSSDMISLFEPLVEGELPTINGSTYGTIWFLGSPVWNHNYSATLSNEYTDAEALLNAATYLGNGSTATNFPRTTGFVSSVTGVTFQLQCSNLIVDQAYLVSYDLWDQTAGTTSTVQIGFVATAATKTINGSIPTPAAGHSVTVRNQIIAFSP